ncbi:hypothetical protein [Vibrio sp. LaRot3]|uniref:hypothetical protein n=1 Tax=Vibrio sp. LaRot3 TaxID=2998829 RepID=UPI0022CDF57E|nr:hypothetical protein [Vibrio sp. LaRot3]MDA0147966.1 hypothetical protein [Vibrio sp. LaRot3]
MRKALITALALIFSASISVSAVACSYDGQFSNPFTESLDGSLDVAFATREALDSKRLSSLEPIEGQKGLRRASWWLTLMVKEYQKELHSIGYIYLIDSHLWSKLGGSQRIKIHSSPEDTRQAKVLLVSEATLYAIVSNELELNNAIELGLVKVSR